MTASGPGDARPLGVLRACRVAVALTGADGAGISLVSTVGHRLTLCSTDPVAQVVEDLQATFGEGPCVDAVGRGVPVLSADLAAARERVRWPGFAPEAVSRPARP